MTSRHIIGHYGFDPIHLSCLVTVLWLMEVDDCFDALCWLAWTCLDLMNLISILPLVQIAWNLICCSLNVFCLSLNFLGIYWAILVLVWLWSFCLLQCDSKMHSLTCLAYEMDLVHSFDVRPIGFYSCLINLDFDQFSLAVLNFSPPFDPRLVLVVLFLMFEFAFQVRKQML